MTYAQALAALEERQETRIELGLERVKAHLARLGSPEKALKIIHVAGTNGKGSTCALLASALRAAGYKTGLYTSPHLHTPLERIEVSGQPISEREFAKVIEKTLSAERDTLTYFELLTVAAFIHFAEQKCEAVVLETGLGGRLDATNVVARPLACVITSIGFDHMAYLGNTLGEIAGEKAGIAKKGVPLICPKLVPSAMAAVRGAVKKRGARLTMVSRPWARKAVNWSHGRQMFSAPFGPVAVGILGEKQGMNAALAYGALKAASKELPVTDAAIKRGFQSVVWPLRFEIRRFGHKTAILDGAHNPEAMRNFAKTFRSSPYARKNPLFIIGMLKDKDAKAVLKSIAPMIRRAVTVAPASPRALGAADLSVLLQRAAPRATVDVAAANDAVRGWRMDMDAPRTAVICGSFYLAAQAARQLGEAHA